MDAFRDRLPFSIADLGAPLFAEFFAAGLDPPSAGTCRESNFSAPTSSSSKSSAYSGSSGSGVGGATYPPPGFPSFTNRACFAEQSATRRPSFRDASSPTHRGGEPSFKSIARQTFRCFTPYVTNSSIPGNGFHATPYTIGGKPFMPAPSPTSSYVPSPRCHATSSGFIPGCDASDEAVEVMAPVSRSTAPPPAAAASAAREGAAVAAAFAPERLSAPFFFS